MASPERTLRAQGRMPAPGQRDGIAEPGAAGTRSARAVPDAAGRPVAAHGCDIDDGEASASMFGQVAPEQLGAKASKGPTQR
jgi:hypothetical protein